MEPQFDQTVNEAGTKDKETCIVKHTLLQNWAVLLQRYKRLKGLRTSDEQGDMAHSLLGMVDILKTGGFFACYVNIHIVCDEICEDLREYLGGFRETIEMAARYFFFNLKKNGRPDAFVFKIRFDDKLAGVHSGRLCTVTDHDETTTYHIKTNYGGPKKSSSRFGMPPKILIEIHVLCSIFCITDVHQDNCGQLNGKTIIIDFAIPFREGMFRKPPSFVNEWA